MKKILIILGTCGIIILVGFLAYKSFSAIQHLIQEKENPYLGDVNLTFSPLPSDQNQNNNDEPGPQTIVEKPLTEKSIVMIVAFRDFNDEEYFIPRQIFSAAGAKKVFTASTEKGTAIGSGGGEVLIDLLVKDINMADFDAVVFVGGGGALRYLDDGNSYRVAKEAVSQGKLVSAICIAPAVLAKAGVLEGKKATVWSSAMDKSAVKILTDNGAIYQEKDVVIDGNIITAKGPEAADPFGMAVIEALME